MQRGFLRLTAVAAALGAMSLATVALGAGPTIQFDKQNMVAVEGSFGEGSNSFSFEATAWLGEGGEIYAHWFVAGTHYAIYCEGPMYEKAVNVSANVASVKATLDPADASCLGNLSSSVTLELTAVANGEWRNSQYGVNESQYGTSVQRNNFQQFQYSASITLTSPSPVMTGTGSARSYREFVRSAGGD